VLQAESRSPGYIQATGVAIMPVGEEREPRNLNENDIKQIRKQNKKTKQKQLTSLSKGRT
jgi:hypothetical protein